MALDFGGARAQFDNMKGGVVIEARDGAKIVLFTVDQRALADLEGIASTSPGALDLPPLKWSSLRYGFGEGGTGNGKEKTYARRDRREAKAGRCAYGPGAAGCRDRAIDRGNGGYVLIGGAMNTAD